jgi:thymidylate kinase
MKRGLCIQFAGVNNIGKSTQIDLLAQWLAERGVVAKRVKFPMYDLGERGNFIQQYLKDATYRTAYRKEYPDAEERVAREIINNHHDFEPQLEHLLSQGMWVIVEGSVIDSLAWSQVNGIEYLEAKRLHEGLTLGDVELLLHEKQGRRFLAAQEVGHVNEGDEARIQRARAFMQSLAQDPFYRISRVDFLLEETREMIFVRILWALSKKVLLPKIIDPLSERKRVVGGVS